MAQISDQNLLKIAANLRELQTFIRNAQGGTLAALFKREYPLAGLDLWVPPYDVKEADAKSIFDFLEDRGMEIPWVPSVKFGDFQAMGKKNYVGLLKGVIMIAYGNPMEEDTSKRPLVSEGSHVTKIANAMLREALENRTQQYF